MAVDIEAYQELKAELNGKAVLVAVSKTKPVEDILALYEVGHRDFGENYVQELEEKAAKLPADIRWHFIGHLQTNKVKYIAPFVHLIQVVDSFKLLSEIDKQAAKNNRTIDCLLQVHIAREETKFGLDKNELTHLVKETEVKKPSHIRLKGLMGMASLTSDDDTVREEFKMLRALFDETAAGQKFDTLSMGMSGDYRIAVSEGSSMVRVGSLIFGERSAK